jgi:hypothetical protein
LQQTAASFHGELSADEDVSPNASKVNLGKLATNIMEELTHFAPEQTGYDNPLGL